VSLLSLFARSPCNAFNCNKNNHHAIIIHELLVEVIRPSTTTLPPSLSFTPPRPYQQRNHHILIVSLLQKHTTATMSIGATMNSTGMSIRSPTNAAKAMRNNNNLEDVELGSSSHGLQQHQRRLKAKDSDLEMTALISPSEKSNGEMKSPMLSPRGAASSSSSSGGEGESSSFMKSLIASAMYSGCSVGMVLVNKSLASRCAPSYLYFAL
jgi:hypothetical protein